MSLLLCNCGFLSILRAQGCTGLTRLDLGDARFLAIDRNNEKKRKNFRKFRGLYRYCKWQRMGDMSGSN